MGKINWRRVFLGGLVAGVVFNVVGIVLGALLFGEGELERALRGCPGPLPPRTAAVLFFLVATIVAGIIVVWWYAAIRPRFGQGPQTAVLAGFALWLTGSVYQDIVYGYIVGHFPISLLLRLVSVHLVMSVAGTVAGAWAYKE